MDRQTQVNGRGDHQPAREVARSASDVWHHVLTLAELQIRLLAAEVGDQLRRARTASLLIALGCLLFMVALPLILTAAALVLVEQGHLTPAEAFGAVAGATFVVSCIFIAAGWWQFRRGSNGLVRSRLEWTLNWGWLKETLRAERRADNRSRSTADR
ncbi:MAG TPA: phage holin family protein [Planctomycetaceae bacterium]|nr:phage holin family protein [Planctomycetaceae bacterium]